MTAMAAGIMSMSELRTLIAKLVIPPRTRAAFIWHWSRWRRQHQTAAAICHRKRTEYMQL
ncbi:hypothetical protein DR046_21120 [Jannaschia formosa]|nr:hypothetical protein DR046_21120 [Jannaschia formosa]